MYNRLAWRNIWRNPRRTIIIITAVFIGVFSMIVMAAFMRGVVVGMVENALSNLTGHIRIMHGMYRVDPGIEHRIEEPERVMAVISGLLPEGTRLASRIRVDAVVANARNNVGITLVGIDPLSEKGVSFIGEALASGSFFKGSDKRGLVVGRALLERLDTRIGKKLVIMSQGSDGEIKSKAMKISGVYRAEMEVIEKGFIFMPIGSVGKMLGIGNQVTEIAMSLPVKDVVGDDPAPVCDRINKALEGEAVRAEHWRQMLPAIAAYLNLLDGFLFIWYLVIFVAMGFGIVNTVLMAVYERMREFGLLIALGMRPSRILRMVLRETLFLLLTGIALGNMAALITIALLAETGINLSAFSQGTEMWGISRIILPVLTAWDLFLANSTVLVLGMAVALYPAVKAARLTPVETMRHT